MKHKYPYIPKEYYPAVMYACNLVRVYGANKAANIAANYYKVEKDKVIQLLRERQGAGQKGTTRKYSWYAVLKIPVYSYGDDAWCSLWDKTITEARAECETQVIKATSSQNAERKASNLRTRYDGNYEGFDIVGIKEFESQEEAEQYEFDEGAIIKNLKKLNVGYGR